MRRRLEIDGRVQGVGFRPRAHRLATSLGLGGWIENRAGSVVVEVQGSAAAVDAFQRGLGDLGGTVDTITTADRPCEPDPDFTIRPSRPGTGIPAFVQDRAPCAGCLAEYADPHDRRGGYLLNTCTDCGPRFTILRRLPWDRAASTLAEHPPCAACRAEYEDPLDRRFHAEGIVCPDCGPSVRFVDRDDRELAVGAELVARVVAVLDGGGVVAIKGLGGHHLAAAADDDAAVLRVRTVKGRDTKPFALLVGDLDGARALCDLDPHAEHALVGPARPVVVAPRRAGAPVADSVAPGLGDLGILLPPSLLHDALVGALGRPLVLTSGNHSGAPVHVDDAQARRVLGPSVEGFVVHDRAIARRSDDAVVRQHAHGVQAVRIGRGDSPLVRRLSFEVPTPVLAVGAHLKNTIAVAVGRDLVVSPHLGDQDHPDSVAAFEAEIDELCRLLGVDPEIVACDLHPDAGPSRWAAACGRRVIPVQHHHAHLAAVLTEHGHDGTDVVGVIADGFGLGTDGTAWGGELLADLGATATRLGHLYPVALPGGDQATRQPWRMAVAWAASVDETWARSLHPDAEAVVALCRAPVTLTTTSVGRLFDAVAHLTLGLATNDHDGHAATVLEGAAAAGSPPADSPAMTVVDGVVDPRDFLQWLRRAPDPANAARAFHVRLGQAMARWAADRAPVVALGGGVFQNRLLASQVHDDLVAQGQRVLTARAIPANDAGISVGQIRVASATLQG